jgi:DNA-binding CsgD family transcriptional regulator
MPIDPLVARHILKLVDAGVLRAVPAQAANEADVDGAEPAGLTPRELEILGWVARGLISREIANRLERSPQTVECHIKNIFRKIGASTRTEAVSKARERGLLR